MTKMFRAFSCLLVGVLAALTLAATPAGAPSPPFTSTPDLRETIKRIKPSIVGMGVYQPTRRSPARLRGTGFVVADGNHVVTSAHVYRLTIEDAAKDGGKKKAKEFAVAFLRSGESTTYRHVKMVAEDAEHDLAVLKFIGAGLPPLTLATDEEIQEGQSVAFTGFPLGAILGLYPVTHRGTVSAITPIALPANASGQLDSAMIQQLVNTFPVYQLDATAYPGNSGSPLFDPDTGVVYGVVNSTFVKRTKEKLLPEPTGITYAIPIRHARKLLQKKGLID